MNFIKNGLFLLIIAVSLFYEVTAQTIVSTSKTPQVVLLEEFTGDRCTQCPNGHKVANQIKEKYPSQFISINIHYELANHYVTPYATPLATLFGIAALPTAVVNRKQQDGFDLVILAKNWLKASEVALQAEPNVNIAAYAEVDYTSRIMTTKVEVYYTDDSKLSINKLNLILLQDNIMGEQSGSENYPEMVEGGKYRHMHMLRDMLTGQWGDEINATKKGDFFTKTYVDTLSEAYFGEAFDIGNLDLVAFVTENQRTIQNAVKVQILIKNAPDNNLAIGDIRSRVLYSCDPTSLGLDVNIKNKGIVRIDELVFACVVNSEVKDTLKWQSFGGGALSNYISPNRSTYCNLPVFNVVIEKNDEIKLEVISINGQSIDALSDSLSANYTVTATSEVFSSNDLEFLKVVVATDQYASEVSWKIIDIENNITVLEHKYTQDLDDIGTKKNVHEVILPRSGCYIFEIADAGKDGIHTEYGDGYYKLLDHKGNLITEGDGKYTEKDFRRLSITTKVSIDANIGLQNVVILYPNPAKDHIRLSVEFDKPEHILVSIYDMRGVLIDVLYDGYVLDGSFMKSINIESYSPGLYFIQISSKSANIVKKMQKI